MYNFSAVGILKITSAGGAIANITIMADQEGPCSVRESALEVFSSEIWTRIIEKLDNSDVITKTLEALPELADLSKGKEWSWRIGEVMPLIIYKYFDVEEILTCRLVSKRWRNAISTTLEENPQRLPYDSKRVDRLSEHHYNYDLNVDCEASLGGMQKCGFGNIDTSLALKSPIIARYFRIFVSYGTEYSFPAVKSFLEKFGPEIRYLELIWNSAIEKFMVNAELKSFIEQVQDLFRHLPNLKSLKLENYSASTAVIDVDFLKNFVANVTPLQLETFDMSEAYYLATFSPNLAHFLVRTFVNHDKVKKFGIGLHDWRDRYGLMFPNLTELCIRRNMPWKMSTIAGVKTILEKLESPHLQKLTLELDDVNIYECLAVVTQYSIKSLELIGPHLSFVKPSAMFQGRKSKKRIAISASMMDLKVVGLPQNFEFLEFLPALENLTILLNVEMGFNRKNYVRVIQRGQEFKPYLLDNPKKWRDYEGVWEMCKKLKIITFREFSMEGVCPIHKQRARECRFATFGG